MESARADTACDRRARFRRPTVPADHSGLVAKRLITGIVAGIAVAALALGSGASWSVTALCAFDMAALVFVIWVWVTVASRRGSDGADGARRGRLTRGCGSRADRRWCGKSGRGGVRTRVGEPLVRPGTRVADSARVWERRARLDLGPQRVLPSLRTALLQPA